MFLVTSNTEKPWRAMTTVKEFFDYVNKHTPSAPLVSVLSSDGTDDEEIAREFNAYFSNVSTVEDVDDIPDPVIVYTGESTSTDIDYTEPEVEAKLKKLSFLSKDDKRGVGVVSSDSQASKVIMERGPDCGPEGAGVGGGGDWVHGCTIR